MNTTAAIDAGRTAQKRRGRRVRVAALAAIVSVGVIGTAGTSTALNARSVVHQNARHFRVDSKPLLASFGAGGHVTYR